MTSYFKECESHVLTRALLPVSAVLLAPYGLAGTLTGHSFRENDGVTGKLLEDWRAFYVVQNSATCENLPLAVEVIVGSVPVDWYSQRQHQTSQISLIIHMDVFLRDYLTAGVRMRYPASFVLMTAEAETNLVRMNGGSVATAATSAPGSAQML